MDTFTSIFTKKFMIWLISRVRHYLTITLRSPADNRGFFYLNKDSFDKGEATTLMYIKFF
ncbi:hypothetical protein CN491_26350 [Bacillus cereus]|uniref:Uncharacterized protein n=1 Tax=Bacillus cereus TaxID=1396 RepID=A0A2C1ERG9_BACCE|nr:hypothetical protein CN491_26350 [Bacillus cereus]PFP74916.1 hypothetical protein COJ95_19790 [Bacillus cereus]PGT15373.1 hypothetical protein COC96_19815 [Bacillus cereus]